jgi:uridine kinase
MLQLSELNQAIQTDPVDYVTDCDAAYYEQIHSVAEDIAYSGRHIIFLAGPSSSGKTTTANSISSALSAMGIRCHAISMDDYYLDVTEADYPKNERGEIDLESPLCLDVDLFNKQMETLHNGGSVELPRFDFTTRRRDRSHVRNMELRRGEAVIVEGIHALNDMFTSQNPHAYTVYVDLYSHVEQNAQIVFNRSWTRLLRRLIRDHNYRNTPIAETLQLWRNVRAGEQRYILPFCQKAHILIDTALGYEVPVLGTELQPELAALPQDVPQRELVDEILAALPLFTPLDSALVPETSLLKREFIK